MNLNQSILFAAILAIINNECAAVTAPKQINLGFAPSASDSIAAFLNPLKKSFFNYLQRPSIVVELQDKILTLERQIRSSREEARQLRGLLNQQRADRRRSKTLDSKLNESIEVERVLQDQMKRLHSRVEELSQIKGKLEALLKQEKDHALKLEKMLEEEREDKLALLREHRKELDALRKEISAKSEEKMKEVEKNIIAKMTLEIDKIKKESETALKLEKAKSAQLEKDKEQAEQAVEREKIKMRKLVKVLADREKSELSQESSSTRSRTIVPITQNASSTRMKTRKFTSHRGTNL